jgi:hypothetical protein
LVLLAAAFIPAVASMVVIAAEATRAAGTAEPAPEAVGELSRTR